MINLYLILSLVTYIFILLRWIFRRRFSVVGLSDNGNANNGKKGKARLFVPCPLSSISCRGGCYRSDLKSSKQVVHLRGYLLKVQIYQPFSWTGCVLPWHINRIFVIGYTLHANVIKLSASSKNWATKKFILSNVLV